MDSAKKIFFTDVLMHWNSISNGRKMPWKGEKNPYRIWLSEIILQQTRVQQGLAYYNKFITTYPSIGHLAAAPETDVFKMWEGLGYYRRCRNMLATAKHIVEEKDGIFPFEFEEINALQGVGPYTAAAIASFAFDLPHAVLDGNVFRVLARFFGIDVSIDTLAGKKYFTSLANDLLNKTKPGVYNQAIMDFGAVICKPLPDCMVCPMQKRCLAYQNNTIGLYPVKEKKKDKTLRWFYYIVAEYDEGFYIRERQEKDIWQNLHEFYLLESKQEMQEDEVALHVKQVFENAGILDVSKSYSQHLTHQTIKGRFFHIRLSQLNSLKGFNYLKKEDLKKIAFPRYINTYFQDSRLLN